VIKEVVIAPEHCSARAVCCHTTRWCFLHPAGKIVTAAAIVLIGGISFSVARHAGVGLKP
jgi:hypothetical protein